MAKKRRYFDDLPGVKSPRANFDLSHRVATTMRPGLLHPIDIVEVLPGDTWSVDSASLVKSAVPFVRPIMDDIFLDTYSFFVPLRLLVNDFEGVFGDSSPSAYDEPSFTSIPVFRMVGDETAGQNIAPANTVYDYLGALTDLVNLGSVQEIAAEYSVLPVRAFAFIWNEFFRNENIDQEVSINKATAVDASELPNNHDWSPTNYAGQLPPVRRYGDYFSTAMLAPQKGPSVKIPIEGTTLAVSKSVTPLGGNLKFLDSLAGNSGPLNVHTDGTVSIGSNPSWGNDSSVSRTNLVVGEPVDGTINALRTAFQLQKYLERDAFYGSRYREYLYSAFGVVSEDSRVQVPEFLGGTHNRLDIVQVMSTSATSTIAQGQFAGQLSCLSKKNLRFSKSVPEHGYIITVACIRYKHLYSQSVQKLWFRKRREDFYDRLFSNLGQKAIKLNEVIGGIPSGNYPSILGYQENFAEYRTILDRVTGQMRPDDGNLGQYWSLADRFNEVPALSDVVHEETDSFERVLSSLPAGEHPFVCDFNFRCSVARVVSPYSMPGFADHH